MPKSTLRSIGFLGPLMTVACSNSGTSVGNPIIHFDLVGLPSSVVASAAPSITVTAKDAQGATVVTYGGTVHFTSSDATALLPSDYTFVSGDGGSHTFTITLWSSGVQTLTATDRSASSITGGASTNVTPRPLFVANSSGNSVTIYAAGARGNIGPIATIGGSNTGIGFPIGLARDAAGHLYVANRDSSSITVYAANASGNVAPITTIRGSNTGQLGVAAGIAVDAAGRLYVAESAVNAVAVFAPGAAGNVAPVDTIAGANTGLVIPEGVALDAAGRLYVANRGANTITVYAGDTTGNASPIATVSGVNTGLNLPSQVVVDTQGRFSTINTFTNGSSSITTFAAGASGDVVPIATILGNNAGLSGADAITLDVGGRLYVTNASANSITIYAAGASGNVAPIITLVGGNTGLNIPGAMTF